MYSRNYASLNSNFKKCLYYLKKISRISNNILDDFLKRIVRDAMCSYKDRKWNEHRLMSRGWCLAAEVIDFVLALNGCTHPYVWKHSKHGCTLSECDNRPGLEQTVIISQSDTSLSGTDCDNIPIGYILGLPFYHITYLIILIFKKMETYYVNKTTNKLKSVLFWIVQLLVLSTENGIE